MIVLEGDSRGVLKLCQRAWWQRPCNLTLEDKEGERGQLSIALIMEAENCTELYKRASALLSVPKHSFPISVCSCSWDFMLCSHPSCYNSQCDGKGLRMVLSLQPSWHPGTDVPCAHCILLDEPPPRQQEEREHGLAVHGPCICIAG